MAEIDVTQEHCPMTFVRVKLHLETLAPKSTFSIVLNGDEPLKNVSRSLEIHGCSILEVQKNINALGHHRLVVQK